MTAPSNGPDTSAFTAQFVEEARERLKSLGTMLLRLEQQPEDGAIIADVLREAHSLKGSAQMLGFLDISQIAHQLEDLFVAAKRDARLIDARAFDLVFRTMDVMAARVEELAGGIVQPVDTKELGGELAAMARPIGAGDRPPEPRHTKEPRPGAPSAPPMRAPMASLRVSVEKLESLAHLAPEMVIQRLKASERHAELRRVDASLVKLRDRIREDRLSPSTRSRAAELGDFADALDVINRRMRALLMNVGDDQARLSLLSEELRQHVIELTMLPVSTVFDSIPRAVRDLSRSFSKDVELVLTGADTALDKRVIEQIADPLTHLVRNAIDHGLESPADRRRAGKPATGLLTIAAEQHGNRMHISVRDDGRGIDPSLVRAAVVRKGLASDAEVRLWTETRLLNVIFEPGFSTRTETTDVSGRGVGMDVVRVVADRLGGSVRLESEIGRGTTVLLDLPLSLALLRVVLVEVSDELLAIPTAPIRSILRVADSDVRLGSIVDADNQTVPIHTLASLLRLPPPDTGGGDHTALIIQTRGSRIAVTVDEVREEQELVFQELRGPLHHQLTMAGAAILGNGDIVPILDVQALSQRVVQAALEPHALMKAAPVATVTGHVLIVEDSLVAGDMLKEILVGAGFEATIAHHGIEALDVLRQQQCDLVITDVDMPEMDGIEFTQQLRADAKLGRLPVIMVTSRDAEEYRQRGVAAGADAYVTKGAFDQHEVLGLVRRMIVHGRPAQALTSSRTPSAASDHA